MSEYPTREEIAHAIYDADCAMYPNPGIRVPWECYDKEDYLADADAVLALFPPATTGQPEPFSTAPFVVAMDCLWCRVSDGGEPYYTNADGAVRLRTDQPPFTGLVVPVKVVAAAEWDALVAERLLGRCDYDSLMVLTENAINATDALGLTP